MSGRRAAVAVAVSLVAAGVIPLGLSMAQAADPACPSFTDPKGDAQLHLTNFGLGPGTAEPTGATAAPDYDILNVAVGTTAATMTVVIQVDKLTAPRPMHEYDLEMTIGGVTLTVFANQDAGGQSQTFNGAGLIDSGGSVKGDATPSFDATTNLIKIVAATDQVKATIGKDPVGLPVALTSVQSLGAELGETHDLGAPTGAKPAYAYGAACSLASSGPAPTGTPTGSSSPSGTPAPTGSPSPSPTGTAPAVPASKLVNAGAVSSQYGDAASVGAKLTDASGAALVGKTVTFKLAGKTGSAKTNSAGVASVKLALASGASAQTLVASFAGDSSAKASSVSTKFTITVEKTKITMATVKSGTARTVTATLLEDDNRALASQKLVVYVNGAKKATLTTDAKGKVVYKAAKAGQTVKFAFTAVSGKWAASSVQQKLS